MVTQHTTSCLPYKLQLSPERGGYITAIKPLFLAARRRAFDSSRRAARPRQAIDECACVYSVSAELPDYFDEQIVNSLIMALTAAEKQKRFREKLKKNPEKYEEAKRCP
ncbi:uncharacterized protein LOC114364140 [Ostrinia furnacalis]|uniref:uncharacterized protein LOC114364140 n=1 Tax=Ostrinia furnacalis TaxID=93504 RepID=UPI00103C1FA3|nr:uncharacterized protein LOC114364140 [Ostrinia furnacalis]